MAKLINYLKNWWFYMKDEYKKYLKIPYKKSKLRHCMSNEKRAGQFMPFSALTGFEERIAEQSRIVTEKKNLSEDEKEILDKSLKEILDNISDRPKVFVRYFVYGNEKNIGSYNTKICELLKFDEYNRKLYFTDMSIVDLDDIIELEKV